MKPDEFEKLCALTRNAIQWHEGRISAEWAHAKPELERLVREGRYWAEVELRSEIVKRCARHQDEISAMQTRLPPYLILRDDGILEMVTRAA